MPESITDTHQVEQQPNGAAPKTLQEEIAGLSIDERYERFKKMLGARGFTIKQLATLATKSEKNWTHVSQVLRGVRRGDHTWSRLADFLTRDELIVLGKEELVKIPSAAPV
jgi:hypothetical protein